MKKLITMLLLVAFVSCAFGITPSISDRKTYTNAYRWTGKPKDTLLDWAEAMEDAIDGTDGVEYLYFIPSTVPSSTEGNFYYNAVTQNLSYYNGSAWQTLGISSSGTLDEAYNSGYGIDVDGGTGVTLTTTAASDSEALVITHGETGAYPALTVTNAGTDPGIEITTSGTGADITGTSATWSISKAGAITCVGATTTGDILVTGASYNIEADVSRDQLHFLDNSVLALGGDTTEVGDITLVHDGSNLLIEAATQDNTPIHIGATNALDILIYDNAATGTATFNSGEATLNFNAYDILMQDGDIIAFGDSDDFTMTATNQAMTLQTLTIDETSAWNFGADTDGSDVKLFGATTGSYMLWDASGDELFFDKASICLSDGDAILFGDTLGTGDFSLSATADVLTYSQVVASTGEIVYGASGVDIPLKWNGETAADWIYFNADEVEFEDVVLQMMDDTQIQFGDGDDFYITSGTAKTLDIIPGATVDSTAVVNIGADGAGADLILFGETASHTAYWDASADEWIWGVNGDGVDVTFYGDTASAEMMWDTTADQLLFAGGAQISLNDAVELLFGTGASGTVGDYEIFTTNGTSLTIDTVVAETGVVEFGVTNLGIDVKLWAATDAEGVLWDASDESLKFVGANIKLDSTSSITTPVEVVAATNLLAITESGKVCVLNHATEFVTTLPAVSTAAGVTYRFIIGAAPADADYTVVTGVTLENKMYGMVLEAETDTNDDGPTIQEGDTITFVRAVAAIGDWVELTSDGVNWYVSGMVAADGAVTLTQAD